MPTKRTTDAESYIAWSIASIVHMIEDRMGGGYTLPQEEIESMTVSRFESNEEFCIVDIHDPNKPDIMYCARCNKLTDFVYITVHEQIDASGYKLSEVLGE